ncbi:GMC family oxidoreductase [Natronoglomus mannanivorans]|uniref:FAD-dependent oxidoreductase n=1 Tax=Natronoglomus mannanivorans TaxID=2979990 RepID=A0AAP2YZT3_9EURY|nr:FAD-dependent oxidoreductase [Halobacteria archaeon AArc-xg1-1]
MSVLPTATSVTDEVDRSPSERVDVCVVGSGPAGALAAYSLAERGHDVVVLEAGPRFSFEDRLRRMERFLRPAFDWVDVWEMGGDRDAYASTGELHYPLNTTRVKGVGGTTLHWLGLVPRYHEKDFEMDSRYGLGEDWPISYDDLRPYYAAVEREMGVAGAADNPFEPPRESPFPMDAFPPSYADSLFGTACEALEIAMHSIPQARNSEAYDGRSQCVGYGTCDPVCPSGAKYTAEVHVAKAEAEGARVIDRAPVQRLEHDESGERLEAVEYATPDGETHRQEARQVVLACGAIETPRLLLLSESDEYPDGLANSSGAAGRYLMEHPFAGTDALLMEETRQNHVGFMTSECHQFYDHDDSTPGSLKLEFINNAEPAPVEIALRDGSWGDDLVGAIRRGSGNSLRIGALVEQLPREENRVQLDTSRTDDHGNPVPEIVWSVGDHAIETMRYAQRIQRRIFNEMGARITGQTDPHNPGAARHPMGTTRMGADPETSVVDARLRTHDIENLTIASSSVFTTGGAMNPTLTIGALSLLAAEYVDEDL